MWLLVDRYEVLELLDNHVGVVLSHGSLEHLSAHELVRHDPCHHGLLIKVVTGVKLSLDQEETNSKLVCIDIPFDSELVVQRENFSFELLWSQGIYVQLRH